MPKDKVQKSKHSCEVCRTLGDVVKTLHPSGYLCGPEREVAQAIQTALDGHFDRVGKDT